MKFFFLVFICLIPTYILAQSKADQNAMNSEAIDHFLLQIVAEPQQQFSGKNWYCYPYVGDVKGQIFVLAEEGEGKNKFYKMSSVLGDKAAGHYKWMSTEYKFQSQNEKKEPKYSDALSSYFEIVLSNSNLMKINIGDSKENHKYTCRIFDQNVYLSRINQSPREYKIQGQN